MSTAFMDPVVLWREPATASFRRIGWRGLVLGAWIVLGGIPGWFEGTVPWTFLRIPLWFGAAVALIHLGLAFGNLARNKGVVLRLMGTGSVEWPRSIQEDWLRRADTWVDGPVISVVPGLGFSGPQSASARATLVGPTRELRGVPLFGVSAEDFAAHANSLSQPRGVSFVVATPVAAEEQRPDELSAEGP